MTIHDFMEHLKNLDHFSVGFGWLCGFSLAYMLCGIEIFLKWYHNRKK